MSAGGLLARLAAAVTVAGGALAGGQGPAAALPAAGPPIQASANRLRVTDQTSWVADGDAFRVGLAVTASDPAASRLQMTVFDALRTRSDFNDSLSDRINTPRRRAFDPVAVTSLGATPALSALVNPKSAKAAVPTLHLDTPGVYPVRLDLVDGRGSLLSRVSTHLVYTASPTSATARLEVALVLPLGIPPEAAGTPGSGGGGPSGPAAAVPPSPVGATTAALAQVAGTLVTHPNVAVTVVPTPQTIDALANGTSSERAVVSQLAQVTGNSGNQTVGGTYVRVDVAALLAAGLDSEIAAQLRQGAAVLSADLRVAPAPGTWVEARSLSPAALDDLAARGVRRLVVRDEALTPLPPDQQRLTPAQPFTVTGRTSRLSAVAADAALTAHLDPRQDPVLAAHQVLAEMALIQEELPNARGGRGVAVVPPDGWRPDAALVAVMLNGLATSPVLSPVTVDRLFADVLPLQQGQRPLVRKVTAPDGQPRTQAISDAAAIRGARRQLASLSTMLPPAASTIADLERLLLISESADVGDRARPARLSSAVHMIANLKGSVRLPGNQSITFTARQGLVPITILSSATYPVRVGIRISSQKLGFRTLGLPGVTCTVGETAEVCIVELRNQNTTVRVPVVAKTAGVFSLTVSLESPDGALTLAAATDTVRSTAASGVGIILSVGAALLLAVWWARDVRHSRRARTLVPRAIGAAATPGLVGTRRGRPRPGGVRPTQGSRAGPRAARAVGDAPTPPDGLPTTPAVAPASGAPIARERRDSFSRHTAVMAAGTLLSRLTGFGRVLALVWAFRLTGITDAYTVANTAPNVLYDLVLGGVLSATLVPVFVDYLGRDDPDEGWRAVSAVITAITAVLLALSAVFWLLAPAVIGLYTALNNTAGAPDQRAIGTTLLRLFVPQLFLLGGIAVTTALLNARRHFAAPAFSPVVNNLVTIAAIVAARTVASSLTLPGFRHDQSALLILGLGTTAGYLLQLGVQLPPMFRAGFALRPVWDLRHPAVRTVVRLSLWTFGSVMANQVSFNLIMVLADQKQGDVAVFTTAYQFFQLPYAIFAVSIASVITPDLSELWARRDLPGFRQQMARGLRLTLAILVPAAVGYVLLAQPFLQLVFHHGSFSSHDARRIGVVVALFAVGLPGFSAYLLLMRAYQAMQDTRSMFVLYLMENAATLVLAAILYPVMGVEGLALGWVGAYSLGAVAAFGHLRTRTQGLDGQAMVAGLARVAGATVVMVVPVIALSQVVAGRSQGALLAQVGGGAIAGAVAYLVAARALGLSEITACWRRR